MSAGQISKSVIQNYAPPALSDFDLAALRRQFECWGHSPTHAGRLLREYYRNAGRVEPGPLKLGRALEARLGREIALRQSTVLQQALSADGTLKLLIGFSAGGAAEAVLMPTPRAERAAGCLSSQIGCAMGCDFCASTRGGLERNLSAGEIVEQFLHLREQAALSGRRLHTLVFMGMGEPLQNLDHVLEAIRRIGGAALGALGWRQITVSTVGIVPGMEQLAASGLNVNLAVSLHAPDDETRSRIVPSNKRYPVAEVLAATRRYHESTGRITNIEYCMLRGINDSGGHATRLAALLRGFRTHVNLIPYNSIGTGLSGAVYQPPTPEQLATFLGILRAAGTVVHLRAARGGDVNAACGQLRQSLSASPERHSGLSFQGARLA